VNDDLETPVNTLSETTGTALAMAMLWAIPVIAFLLSMARM
jgi:hypothetical protein